MASFKIGSYQLAESKKWVPSGMINTMQNRDTLTFQEQSFPDKHYDTEKEANDFFASYFLKQGYKEGK